MRHYLKERGGGREKPLPPEEDRGAGQARELQGPETHCPAGLMFWLAWKRFVGSNFLFNWVSLS